MAMEMDIEAYPPRPASVQKVRALWTSAADGSASAATVEPVNGKIIALRTAPGAGDDQPSDNYDVTVTDRDGSDVLLGAGANRSNASVQLVASASLGAVAESVLTIAVANAGDSNTGTVEFWVQDDCPAR